jgi:F-type H+-transporting ATPase subunit gamma
MTERLADITRQIGSVGQLADVVGAMRALAAARAREARAKLDGVRGYARAIADAIGRALPMLDEGRFAEPPRRPEGALAILAFGAEQGFAGAFNARILDAVAATVERREGASTLLLVGGRALIAAEARRLRPDWSHPMIAHLDRAAELADAIAARLFEELAKGAIAAIHLIHAAPGSEPALVERPLAPFDYSRFPALSGTQPPLTTLAPASLIARLAEEYMFAEIVEAAILSFAAENEARLRAMTSARRHIDERLDRLNGRARVLRQEEITNEIVELAAGAHSMTRGWP